MYLQQFLGLALSALLTINTGSVINPAITWLNNSSLNITIGSSVNYYFDLEFNEWYPVSGSVDTGGTGRCDTNIIIGNGTDPMTGFIQYDRSSVTRGTNLISYDENVAVTSNMIYFYNVSSFTLTTFTSTDTGDLNQPTFTVNFTDGYIWDERDDSDLYAIINLMLGDISAIKQNETNVYNAVVSMGTQLGLVQSSIDAMALNIVSIDSKVDNIVSYLSTINSNINTIIQTLKFYKLDSEYNINYWKAVSLFRPKFSTYTLTPNDFINTRAYWKFNGTNANNDLYSGYGDVDYLLIFGSTWGITGNDIPYTVYTGTDTVNDDYEIIRYSSGYSTPYIIGIRFKKTNTTYKWSSIKFSSNNGIPYYPIYFGNTNAVPDYLAAQIGFDKYADTTSAIDEANSALEQAAGTEEAFSQQTQQNFTNQIGQINTTDSVVTNSSFQRSANWVATQFNNLTNNNAFGSILGFSLLLGLAMAIIGRVIK